MKNLNVSLTDMTDMSIFIRLMLFFTVVGINIFTIFWILRLEKKICKCSENWKRTFIKYYLMVATTVSVVSNIYTFATMQQPSSKPMFIFLVLGLLSVLNMIFTVYYISDLITDKCECSEDIIREVYYYQQYIYMILFGIIISFYTLVLVGTLAFWLFKIPIKR